MSKPARTASGLLGPAAWATASNERGRALGGRVRPEETEAELVGLGEDRELLPPRPGLVPVLPLVHLPRPHLAAPQLALRRAAPRASRRARHAAAPARRRGVPFPCSSRPPLATEPANAPVRAGPPAAQGQRRGMAGGEDERRGGLRDARVPADARPARGPVTYGLAHVGGQLREPGGTSDPGARAASRACDRVRGRTHAGRALRVAEPPRPPARAGGRLPDARGWARGGRDGRGKGGVGGPVARSRSRPAAPPPPARARAAPPPTPAAGLRDGRGAAFRPQGCVTAAGLVRAAGLRDGLTLPAIQVWVSGAASAACPPRPAPPRLRFPPGTYGPRNGRGGRGEGRRVEVGREGGAGRVLMT